jgi:serine/threonine-protein kinase
VGADGVPRLVDFGVAKATGRGEGTREGTLKGKLPYMAPEQCRGETVTRRCDIWSASAVIWEILTGRRLFNGESEPHIYAQVVSGRIKPPSKHAEDIPPELDAVVMRGLQRDTEARFPTAREMALELEDCMRPATAAEVGLWVARLAAEKLDERARCITEIERGQTQRRQPCIATKTKTSIDPTAVLDEPPSLDSTTLLESTTSLETLAAKRRRSLP